MSGRARVTLAAVLAAGLVAASAGCGLPAENSAREVEPPRGPYQAWTSQTPQAADSGTVPERLYLLDNDKLVLVVRHVRTESTIDELIRDLLAGPTDGERRAGLTSALLGSDVIAGARLTGGEAVIELTARLDQTGRTDQVLAFAQIVCTLTARPEITGVTFTRDGRRIGVPRADGSLSQGPLTASDYSTLVTSR